MEFIGRSSRNSQSRAWNWCAAERATCTDRARSGAWSMSFPCDPQPGKRNFAPLTEAKETYDTSLLLEDKHGPWGVLAAGRPFLGTDGYIQEARTQRGPVDAVSSNVHSQNALLLLRRTRSRAAEDIRSREPRVQRIALTMGRLIRSHATRSVRYATGADWEGTHNGSLVCRESTDPMERYRQTFSSISNASRCCKSDLYVSLRRERRRFTFGAGQ